MGKSEGLKLCTMQEVVAYSIVRAILFCSVMLDILPIGEWGDFDLDLDMFDRDFEDVWDDQAKEKKIMDDLSDQLNGFKNLETMNQRLFCFEKDFVDAPLKKKIKLLFDQLQHGNQQIYQALWKHFDNFDQYKGTLVIPNNINLKNVAYYSVRFTGKHAGIREGLNVLSSRNPTRLTKKNAMMYVYLTFLMYMLKNQFSSGSSQTTLNTKTLEKLEQLSESTTVEFVLQF